MRRKLNSILAGGVAASSLLVFSGAQANADETLADETLAEERDRDEVVVTARRREESLLETPIPVTALDSETLYGINAVDLEDISAFTPGFNFQQSTFTTAFRFQPQIRFRGMNPPSGGPTYQVGAVFIDGVFTVGDASSLAADDVERVEVIRGPQSAYFGRNTFGGAVNFVTRKPDNEISGSLSGRIETRDSYEIAGSVEGALIDDVLAARVFVKEWQRGSHYTTNDGGDFGRQKTSLISTALYFTPNENFEARFRGSYSHNSDYGNPSYVFQADDSQPAATAVFSNCQAPGATRTWWCGALPNIGDTVQTTAGPVLLDEAFISKDTSLLLPALADLGLPNALVDFVNNTSGQLSSLEAVGLGNIPSIDHFGAEGRVVRLLGSFDWTLAGDHMLSGNFGYGVANNSSLRDADEVDGLYPGGGVRLVNLNGFRSRDLSAELRLTSPQDQRFRYMVGANFIDQELDGNSGGGGARLSLLDGESVFPIENGRDRSEVYGFFGALSFDVTDQITIDLEGRYQIDELKVFTQLPDLTFDPVFETFNEFMPRAIISYRPTDQTNLFFSWSKGSLPGIANVGFESVILATAASPDNSLGTTDPDEIRLLLSERLGTVAPAVLDSQRITNYELGWKQSLMDDHVNFSLSGYHYKWDNYQFLQFFLAFGLEGPGTARFVVVNVPVEVEAWGVEGEVGLRPIDGLTINLAGEYVSSEFQDVQAVSSVTQISGLTNLAGAGLIQYPVWSFSANSRYTASLKGDWDWYVAVQAAITGRQYADEANLSWVGSYAIVDPRIGVQKDNLNIEFFINNALDYDGFISARRVTAANGARGLGAIPSQRRTYGIRARVNF